jgi:hypothetical protein
MVHASSWQPSGLPDQVLQTVGARGVEPVIGFKDVQGCFERGNLGHGRSFSRDRRGAVVSRRYYD